MIYFSNDLGLLYISIDSDGDESVCAFQDAKNTWYPLVCADWDRAQSFKQMVQEMSNMSNTEIKLIKLYTRSEIEKFLPKSS